MGKLKIGVIGCGGIANQKHFSVPENVFDLLLSVILLRKERLRLPESTVQKMQKFIRIIESFWQILK